MKGILLDDNNDLLIRVKKDAQGKITGGLVTGETKIQNAYMVLSIKQGELKEDPVLGVNLNRYIRGREDAAGIQRSIRIGLMRAGIELEDIKDELKTIINRK
jgi:hypothetical protein